MLLIWIVMLVAGLWALFTGKLPMVLFSGFGTHKVEGMAARVIGIGLALSAPVSFVSMLALSLLFESNGVVYTLVGGLGPTLLVMIGATLAVRAVRTPYPFSSESSHPLSPEAIETDRAVRQKVQRSMYLLALGLGLSLVAHAAVGVVVFPLAYLQANKAIAPTEEASIKDRYRDDVILIRLLSIALIVFSVLIACGYIT